MALDAQTGPPTPGSFTLGRWTTDRAATEPARPAIVDRGVVVSYTVRGHGGKVRLRKLGVNGTTGTGGAATAWEDLSPTDGAKQYVVSVPVRAGDALGIDVTGVSVNPARSIGPAIFAGAQALSQLWLFILAPLAGGALAGALHGAGITRSTHVKPRG